MCHYTVPTLRLDYCNVSFTVLSTKNMGSLQQLQNSAACFVSAVGGKTEADEPFASDILHWLLIQKRIIFIVLLYMFKALNNLALLIHISLNSSLLYILLVIFDQLCTNIGYLVTPRSHISSHWQLHVCISCRSRKNVQIITFVHQNYKFHSAIPV